MFGGLFEETAAGAEAGVGEDGVEAAEGVQRGLSELLLVLPVGDVAADGEGATRVGRIEVLQAADAEEAERVARAIAN